MQPETFVRLPYPEHRLFRLLLRLPMLLFRLGFGPLIGRLFLILTTRGRKSGLPRRTALEYHVFQGRKFVVAAWPKADWYRNLLADPLVTVQSSDGTQSMRARRIVEDQELHELYDYVEQHPMQRTLWRALGFDMNRDTFLAQKDKLHIVCFEPITTPTPQALAIDLLWVWPVTLLGAVLICWVTRRLSATPHSELRLWL